jgi:hypothetical protein
MLRQQEVLMKYGIHILVAGAALMAAAPVSATTLYPCDNTFPNPDSVACAGYYSGNLLSGADVADQQSALNSIGYSGTVDWTALTNGGDILSNLNSTDTINFGKMLSGITYIGMHFGNINDSPQTGNVSVFWKFDFTTPTDHITLTSGRGSSDAVLYSTGNSGVPEPATWAMMLVGFAGIGFAVRRKRSAPDQLLQLA